MSEKKAEEFYILTQDGMLPFNVVRNEGEAAEICAMIKRSNNPDFIHTIEHSSYRKAVDALKEIFRAPTDVKNSVDIAEKVLKELGEL